MLRFITDSSPAHDTNRYLDSMATRTTIRLTGPANALTLRGEPTVGPRSKSVPKPLHQTKKDEQRHLKERLAASFRIFSKLGYDEGTAGHISVRDVINPQAFWVNPFGVAFDLMTVSDLLLIDHDGIVLEGGRPGEGQLYNAAGFAIHGSIHRARPDIHAAAHSHSTYGRAFSALGRNIDIASQDAASFGETVRLYNDFGGVVLDDQEGRNICEALGPHGKGIILQNHGILTAAQTVDAAVAYFVRLEQLCESQMLSDALGRPRMMEGAEVEKVFELYGGEDEAYFQAQEMFEMIDYESGRDYTL